jgi:predicted hydrolase (HD superfamily)
MLTRQEALDLLMSRRPEPHLVHHALESEAVLRAVAVRLGRDEALWGLVGLLHDLDYPETKDDPARHGLETALMLAGRLPEEGLRAIRAHNWERNGAPGPETDLDFGLRAGETVTGLISANAMVRPERMSGMKPKSLKKKMKEKAFAASVDREVILESARLGLDLDEFFAISIGAMEAIAPEVGLA